MYFFSIYTYYSTITIHYTVPMCAHWNRLLLHTAASKNAVWFFLVRNNVVQKCDDNNIVLSSLVNYVHPALSFQGLSTMLIPPIFSHPRGFRDIVKKGPMRLILS